MCLLLGKFCKDWTRTNCGLVDLFLDLRKFENLTIIYVEIKHGMTIIELDMFGYEFSFSFS